MVLELQVYPLLFADSICTVYPHNAFGSLNRGMRLSGGRAPCRAPALSWNKSCAMSAGLRRLQLGVKRQL